MDAEDALCTQPCMITPHRETILQQDTIKPFLFLFCFPYCKTRIQVFFSRILHCPCILLCVCVWDILVTLQKCVNSSAPALLERVIYQRDFPPTHREIFFDSC